MLHDLGQSLWLDNITRDLLRSGTLKRYIDELSVTGLTSNPTIFDQAIKSSTSSVIAIVYYPLTLATYTISFIAPMARPVSPDQYV